MLCADVLFPCNGRGALVRSSCPVAACSKLVDTSLLRRRAAALPRAATVDIPDVSTPPIDEVPCLSPNALQLESGELSKVVRDQSNAPEDIFRCVGCTDAACQVMVFLSSGMQFRIATTSCDLTLLRLFRALQAATRQHGDTMKLDIFEQS